MMTQRSRLAGRLLPVGGALALVAVGFLFAIQRSVADEPAGWGSIQRDVVDLEDDLDDLLLDSPNFLVSGRDDAHGIYLDEVGLILTFDASLVDDGYGGTFSIGGIRINRGRVIIRDHDGWDDEEDLDEDDSSRDSDQGRRDRRDRDGDRSRNRIARRYERGKEELVDFMVDSGDRVGGLKSGQSIQIIGTLDDSRYLRKQHISRLVVKARVDDLKAHASGSLSDDALRERVLVQEY